MVGLNFVIQRFHAHVLFENNYCNKCCFRHWGNNQPNGYPTRMCLFVDVNGHYPAHNHYWADADCSIHYRYICEVDPTGIKVI